MKKMYLTVSGDKRVNRGFYIHGGGLFIVGFDKNSCIAQMASPLCTLDVDYGKVNPEVVKDVLDRLIERVRNFDKQAALAELEQMAERVDEIVSLVK